MKNDILLQILFDLLAERKVTARDLSDRYGMSVRSIYRYVDVLSLCVPLQVAQGRNGGISISDTYKLPKGFMTAEEYDSAIEALDLAYAHLAEDKFLAVKRKLSAQRKSEVRDLTLSGQIGTILVDGDGWGDTRRFSDKMRLLEECVKTGIVLEIEYNSRMGETSVRKIEPHVLVFKQGVWYVYAFCRKQRDFRLFRLGRIVSAVRTEEKFNRKPIEREQIPLNYWTDAASERVKLEITERGFADALDWLGRESLRFLDGKWYADVVLPFDEILVKKIASFGKEMKVLAPQKLADLVVDSAKRILELYRS